VAELGATYDSAPEADAEGRNLVEVRIPPEAVTLTNKQVRLLLDCAPLAFHVAYFGNSGHAGSARAVDKANTLSMLLKLSRQTAWVWGSRGLP
jgi:hypothetical protein